MALLLSVRRIASLSRIKGGCTCPVTSVLNKTMCSRKSFDETLDEASENNKSSRNKSLSRDFQTSRDVISHNCESQALWDELDPSDFSGLARKYGDETEGSNEHESSEIDVVSVSDILKDMMKDKSFRSNKKVTTSSSGKSLSRDKDTASDKGAVKVKGYDKKNVKKQSYDTLEVKNRDVGNLKTIKFHPKYSSAKSKAGVSKKKIILLNKSRSFTQQSHVKYLNQEFDYSQKKLAIPNTFSSDSDESWSSLKNAYSVLEDRVTSRECVLSENIGVIAEELNSQSEDTIRKNCLGIQMLSPSLYRQIFSRIAPKHEGEQEQDFLHSKTHLEDQHLWGFKPSIVPNADFHLPSLEGLSLEDHFYSIAEKQCAPYKKLLDKLITSELPNLPSDWQFTSGWTRYNSDGTFTSVGYPTCHSIVFDVELCVKEGSHPVLATAVSDKYWYSWCSDQLITGCNVSEVGMEDLIPLESCHTPDKEAIEEEVGRVPRVVVGHNVSFDRLRVREQYQLRGTALKFVDTMSLHIAASGLVSEQRALTMKNKSSETKIRLPWMSVGCQNNLNDVYKFYCKVKEDLKKDIRDVFVKGTLQDVRDDFQNLVSYCANDVNATLHILKKLLPLFFHRFPHPVTFSGMLEMGSTFLPVTENWNRYLASAEAEYNQLERLLNEELVKQAQEALALKENGAYRRDPWLWSLDWSVPKGRVKTLPGYPNWYRKLCAHTGEREGTPEPENMSTSLQIVPKLLRLTWDGYPLHYDRKYGWGYLKPLYENVSDIYSAGNASVSEQVSGGKDKDELKFPVDVLYEMCSGKRITLNELIQEKQTQRLQSPETEEDWQLLLSGDNHLDKAERKRLNTSREVNVAEKSYDIGIPGVGFVPLPHKDGPGNRVGNPLAKDFLHKIEDNTLSSHHGDVAKVVLKTNKMLSYWKNNRDRILSQMVIWNEHQDSQNALNSGEKNDHKIGIILPMVVSAGTITRRAVEPTWMTASNAYADRIGSELKAMIEAPPGYRFVGADVDSQELWIAAVLGDAYFSSEHGATAFGWMTLQGKKADGSDLHSRTADMAGISRDHAKVINYGRIYGAGIKFIQRLLKQFNHSLSDEEALSRAKSLFEATKGKKGWILNEKGLELASAVSYPHSGGAISKKEINRLVKKAEKNGIAASLEEIVDGVPIWVGGSESHMFNCLEAIARSETPRTPVLGARITRTLEPKFVDDQFMTSRVNWVVQSSAVDYLHLMLVSMRWLFEKFDISGRFCISIHDEVRYLVTTEDRHRAALALQITNLLTRSLFAVRLGFKDLPMSVAFFSSVDIDQVLRKEPNQDCVTPSNSKGLQEGYGIPPGESLDIEKILQITKGRLDKTEER